MLLIMLEKNMPIDEIIYCDTGKEFPAMVDHIDKVESYIGRSITRIKGVNTFDYNMFERPVKRRNKDQKLGYSWPGPLSRWCTSKMKTDVIGKYLSDMSKEFEVVHYVGIAADEPERVKDKTYPLVDWGMRERESAFNIVILKVLTGVVYMNYLIGFRVGVVHYNHFQNLEH